MAKLVFGMNVSLDGYADHDRFAPVAAAMLIATGEWDVKQMANVEEMPPKPFINLLNKIGLPTRIQDENGDRAVEF